MSLDLADANPDATRALALARSMDERLLASLDHVTDAAGKALGKDLGHIRATVRDGLCSISETSPSDVRRLTSSAYAFHAKLLRAARAKDGGMLLDCFDAFEPAILKARAEYRIRPYPAPDGSSGDSFVHDVIRQEHLDTYGYDPESRPPTATTWAHSSTVLRDVLERLRRIDPDCHDEVAVFVRDFALADTQRINAGTSFPAFGCMFLATLRPAQEWTAYLEHVVHEAAHHHLFALWTQDPIVEELGEFHRSPLRPEPRPISGIFHAMFVLARVLRSQRVFMQHAEFADDITRMATQYNNAGNPAPFASKFREAAAVVRASGKMTALGRRLFESSLEMAGV